MSITLFYTQLNSVFRLSFLWALILPISILSAQEQNDVFFKLKPAWDTSLFHFLSERFHNEVAKRYDMNVDSMAHYGEAAKQAAISAGYEKGLIRICLGLGTGYIDKNNILLAKHSFSLAIEKATAIRDTQLLTRAYAGYGWALIYDNSDYEGSIKDISIACDLARASKDSSLINTMSTKLARVPNYKTIFLKF